MRYSVLLTGDHSTPVMFGDHSHEPVPLAMARVRDVVAALGRETVEGTDCGELPTLSQHMQVRAVRGRERRLREPLIAAACADRSRGASGAGPDQRNAAHSGCERPRVDRGRWRPPAVARMHALGRRAALR